MVLTVGAQWLEIWAWVLIYGGLLLLCLGLFVLRGNAPMGWMLVLAGAVLAAVGAALILVRARLPDSATPKLPARKE